MKKIIITFVSVLYLYGASAQTVSIPDADFLQALKNAGADQNNDGQIQVSEAAAIHKLDVSHKNIVSLAGIEAFVNLDTLNCSFNKISAVDFSQNTELIALICSRNLFTNLNVSSLSKLVFLSCSNSQLSGLTLSANTKLEQLDLGFGRIESLDLTNNTKLKVLECYVNKLTSLDVSSNPDLVSLYCSNNLITSLDLSENPLLNLVDCSYNKLTSIDLSQCTELTNFECYSNLLSTLNLMNNTKLLTMDVGLNPFEALNLSTITGLTSLDCAGSVNLKYVCVPDVAAVTDNFNFYKDDATQWTEDCSLLTGIKKVSTTKDFVQLYPNPGKEIFYLKVQQPSDISIRNATGMELEKFSEVQNIEFGQNYTSGIYFITVLTGNEHRVLKLVKE